MGTALYTNDFFFLAQILYSFQYLITNFLLKKNSKLSATQFWVLLLFLLTILKIFYSYFIFGTLAFVTSRAILYFLGNILFFSLGIMSPKRILKFFQIIFFFSFIYLFVALFRYLGLLPSLYYGIDFMVWEDDFSSNRLLDKDQLMFILFGSIFSLSSFYHQPGSFRKIYLLFFILFSLLIVFSNTRSIILVYLLGMTYFLIVNNIFNIKFLFISIVTTILLLGSISFFDIALFETYFSGFTYENLFSENSTFFWRGLVSLGYLSNMTFAAYFIGMSFGNIPIIFVEQFTSMTGGTAGLHNFYVQIFYYYGLPITLMIFGFIMKIFIKMHSLTHLLDDDIKNIHIINMMIFQIFICYLAWPSHILEAIIIGLSICMFSHYEKIKDIRQLKISK
ncbi:MAG: hypothetical protein CMG20_02225 [Candidatus Marinimicrobia bacterium]|nr:hypothetical protein [Candidatus Neomarinimicrobiota bacterium]